MASYFFDSNALVKRYYREPGTDWVRTECASPQNVVYISEIALTEVVITIHKKARQHRDFRRYRDTVIAAFRQHTALGAYHIWRLTPTEFVHAGDLGRQHGISSQDALQLACALEQAARARSVGAAVPLFVSADRDLRRFAEAEDLRHAVNPETHATAVELAQRPKYTWRERAAAWCDSLQKRCKRLLLRR
jgi:predicted nucleic acid-binding protein